MRRTFRLSLLAAAAALLSVPHESVPQAAADDRAARTLLATNLADAIMHPAKGEDTDFFIRAGGIPNLFFLIDSSGSMERLPPDGPATYGKSSPVADPVLPPGVVLDDPGSSAAVNAARAGRTILGCGLDPVSSVDPAFSQNPMIQHIQGRKFYPPCGTAHTQDLVSAPYAGHAWLVPGGADYAYQSSVCPYYTPSNSQAVWPSNRGGYDPDFYNEAPNASQVPDTLWVRDYVYHDSIFLADAYSRSANDFGHNFGKGWTASAPPKGHPAKVSGGGYASIDAFCAEQGTTALANGQVPADVCKTCLKQAGWYYDGVILSGSMDGSATTKRYPSIWYSGNYLSFFPPKFVVLRKIVKDVIATQSKIRMALGRFGTAGFSLLKEFNPTCAHPDSSFDSNRGAYVNLLNDVSFTGSSENTPLALALFDVGRFYHSPGLTWFGDDWEKTGNSWESSANSNDFAICYSCQTSSVVLLTDGIPNAGDGTTLPPGAATLKDATDGKYAGAASTGILGASTDDCPFCGEFSGTGDYKNNLTRVSWYLHNFDLRNNSESTKDCKANGGRQTLDVYTVGYATRALEDANRILAGAAKEGGGIFVAAENPQVLKEGLLSVIEEINGRSTSFSVATVSNLQTTTGHSVVVPRFDPAKSPFWEGHLYRYEMYSEFVNECDPAKSGATSCCAPNNDWDYDCDGKCQSVYLQDMKGAFIQEGTEGALYKNDPVDRAACIQAPRCAAAGKTCGGVGSSTADPWWDAGLTLKRRDWRTRKIFTVVDSDGNARLDPKDGNLELPLVLTSEEKARAFLPYLGNANNGACSAVANRIETAGDDVTAAAVRTNEVECARAVVRWVLGADVFNEAGRRATDSPPWPPPPLDRSRPATVGDPATVPPTPANLRDQDLLPDRPFKLGDIFHSSPVVVNAPSASTSILCNLGLDNQCLRGLWAARKDEAPTAEAEYDRYAANYYGRRRVLLVGANDGLVHAFNGGTWHAAKYPGDPAGDDPVTALKENQPPFNGYYDRSFDPSSADSALRAAELWAFLPPDMISKLPLVFAGEHQIFVDGTAMVRDVWADGSSNAMGRSGTTFPPEGQKDDVKQAQEFHTVAVFGERRGGTHYFALDVTEATKLSDEKGFEYPRFLWMYPQPDERATLTEGETYTDFLPKPPPIGPVRIKADSRQAGTPVHEGVPYNERWIAFLSGGYDPQLVRGRGVHMVDVWNGAEYFDFSFPYAGTVPAAAPDDPRWHLRYPVASVVGMTQWGPGSRRENGLGQANNLFFDTATFGDTGGQLWVVRFHEPGELGSGGKVTNWFGARVFQMGGRVPESMGYAHPFFYITANLAMPGAYTYRAYLGTGDRFNLLDTGGGICGPDNLRACAQRGCRVYVDPIGNFVRTPELGKFYGSQAELGRGVLSTSGAFDPLAPAAVEARARVTVSACPADTSVSFVKDVYVSCTPDSQGRWGCTTPIQPRYGGPLELSNATSPPVTRNWYYSLKVFDDTSPRTPFTTRAGAKAYDDARYWILDTGTELFGQSGGISIMPASSQNPPASATAETPGWAIYYDHGPTAVADGHTYTVSPLDERTSSVTGVGGSGDDAAITWNTTQPSTGTVTSTSGNCFASKCSGEDRRVAYHYAAHPLTGGSVLKDDLGNPVRSRVSNTLVPAQGDQTTVFLNQRGQVQVGLTVVNPEKGAASIGAGEAADAVKELGWIEVSRETHSCRHAQSATAAVCR